jgi:hypothetical protein
MPNPNPTWIVVEPSGTGALPVSGVIALGIHDGRAVALVGARPSSVVVGVGSTMIVLGRYGVSVVYVPMGGMLVTPSAPSVTVVDAGGSSVVVALYNVVFWIGGSGGSDTGGTVTGGVESGGGSTTVPLPGGVVV